MVNSFVIKKSLTLTLCIYVTLPLTSSNKHSKPKKIKVVAESRWTGHITMEESVTISQPPAITAQSKRTIQASFVNALPTLYRDDETTDFSGFTDNKGSGMHTYHSEGTYGTRRCVSDCSSSDKAELHAVVIEEEDNRYYIEVVSPTCVGTATNCDGDGAILPFEESQSVTVSNHPLGANKDILTGTKTETGELPAGFGTYTRTTKWNLVRSTENDVELIVTPEKYDTWLPEPGRNERTVGSVMNVSLKLQGRNGSSTNKKAKSFELRLLNTSTEPGMTINFPVNSSNTSPDLRFMSQANAVMLDTTYQSMKIICLPSTQTSVFKIGSYDGGGWTILNAEAILDDNTTVKGRLLVSNGEMDIRIPKRDPNSKIGTYWLTANGNPNEMDDTETSTGNTNNGDGITAYEEYRGVISEGRHKRLNPNKKEVGVQATQTDFSLFSTGLGWFESAGDIKVVRFDFDKDEIAPDGTLNMNKKSAHDFDQHAIYIFNGGLGSSNGTLGVVYCQDALWIPANISGVIIDWNKINASYQRRVNNTRPETLKFTVSDYLAQTVAHEIGHAVNIDHHGGDIKIDTFTVLDPFDRILRRNGSLITTRPIMLKSIGEIRNTVESGDLKCMLNYYPYFQWGYTRGADGAKIFNQEPLIPLGRSFCKTINGTDFNATGLYFGDGAKGNCLSQILLRN